MPAKGVKVKQSNVNVDDMNDLNSMFGQMTGAQNADPDIIIPKLIKINDSISRIGRIFKLLLDFKEFITSFSEYDNCFKEISEFIDIIDSLKFTTTEEELSELSDDELNRKYTNLKTHDIIQKIIVTSSNLSDYKRFIFDKNDLG